MNKHEGPHFGHLPVWIDGNAYFEGARAYNKEKNFFVDIDKAMSPVEVHA